MFTGIITHIGRVTAVVPGGDTRLEIDVGFDTEELALGASIACSGPCLTVVDKGPGWFAVNVSAETLRRTTLGRWRPGTRVNLERALRMGDEFGGHLVTGHVDGVAELWEERAEGASRHWVIDAPADQAHLIAPKGSVTLDGVSLTVNEVAGNRFTVNLIPHTLAHTTLGAMQRGAGLNLEIDLVARYLQRLVERRGSGL